MIGPVGFAETSSTWMRSGVSRGAGSEAPPCLDDRREARRASQRVVHRDVQEPRARDVDRRDAFERATRSASSAATSRGGRRAPPASRSATFVA